MSTIQIATTEVANYALKVDEAFDYPNINPTIVLDACPSSSELVTVESAYSTGDSFTFNHTMSTEHYMSNALKFRFDFPLEVTLQADADVVLSANNFMEKAFNNCEDLCISQYGLLQAMQSCQVSLNGKVLNIPTQIPECINILSQYYNSQAVAEWFPASQQDMFQSFEQYSGNSRLLKFIDEDGETAYTAVSPEQDNNIFSAKYTRGYMSRTPIFKWLGGDATAPKSKCKVRCIFFAYLPLSIGSVPDKVDSLVGVHNLSVQVTMKPGMTGYLFNAKDAFFNIVKSIDIDRSTQYKTKGSLMFQKWGAPNGTTLPRTEAGLLAPYSIQFPDLNLNQGNVMTNVGPGSVQRFNYSNISCNSVPKSIYIAIVKIKNGSFMELVQTPINYGLINSLEINAKSLKTNYMGVAQLSYLADTNGYDAFTDTLGRLTKGFAVMLDVTKDLSVLGTTCVGASGTFDISVTGTFINQGAVAADYQLVVLTSIPASLDFDGANFSVSSGVLIDAQKLLSSDFMRDIRYNYGRRMNVLGGGIWSNIKKGAVNLAKTAWANRHEIAKVGGDVLGLIKTVRGGERMYTNTSGAGAPLLGAGSASTTQFFPQGAGRPQGADIWKRKH